MSLIERFIGVFAPHECLSCGCEGALACPKCIAKLPPARQTENVKAVTVYGGLAKALLWKLKSNGAQAAAEVMAEAMCRLLPAKNVSLVPLPTASSRVRQRGYDQAILLAKCLSRKTNYPVHNALIRQGQAHQVGADREQRVEQLSGAFRLKSLEPIENKEIVLIDDVVTTGATLEAAAKILMKKGGARKVSAVVFAQA